MTRLPRGSIHLVLDRIAASVAAAPAPGHMVSGGAALVQSDDERGRDELLEELRRLRAQVADLGTSPLTTGEQLFGGLLDAAPDGIVISDERGVIRLVNTHAERLFGYGPGELVGQTVEVLVPEALRAVHLKDRTGYHKAPVPRRMGIGLRLVARRKDGTEVPTEISLSPLETVDGRFVVTAIRDVTERRETEDLLRKQADALARSNDQLQQFAYVASHDLQEPLRMVSSYLQLLERRYATKLDDDAREFIGFAADGAKRMQALIQDLLAYSRAGAGEEHWSHVDLADTVAKVGRDLEVAVKESGGRLQIGRLPVVTADPTEMSQLFQNLIGNALKFRRPDGAPVIDVSARREGDGWLVSVADNGIGIHPQHHERVFQIFQRLHTRQEYPGTGIGLALCKRIVEHHGGTIRVESTPGVGSTLHFTIPDRRHP